MEHSHDLDTIGDGPEKDDVTCGGKTP
jgi:hypothetical protein